jgi:chromosome segregation ATPase
VHNTFEYHDQRSQQVNVGIDPMVFSNMVSEARRVIQESEEKAQGLEQLAQEAYQQACCRIQELVNLAEALYNSNCSKTSEIEMLQRHVQSTRDQLQVQIDRNQALGSQIAQFESQMSNIQNLFGHKDAEITRLMSEVSRLRSSEARLEERLAALSAAPSAVATSVEAPLRSAQVDISSGILGGTVDGDVVEGPNGQLANEEWT